MGEWFYYSGQLLINSIPIEKITPLPSEDIMEK